MRRAGIPLDGNTRYRSPHPHERPISKVKLAAFVVGWLAIVVCIAMAV